MTVIALRKLVGLSLLLSGCVSAVQVAPPSPPSPPPTVAAASATPTASPGPSPAPTPIGFVLPPDCSYVPITTPRPATPAPATPVHYWDFTCVGAATPDLMAVERISPAFAQQGWTPCPSNPGTGRWWKGAIQTMVGQGSPYPGISQLARQTQDCP